MCVRALFRGEGRGRWLSLPGVVVFLSLQGVGRSPKSCVRAWVRVRVWGCCAAVVRIRCSPFRTVELVNHTVGLVKDLTASFVSSHAVFFFLNCLPPVCPLCLLFCWGDYNVIRGEPTSHRRERARAVREAHRGRPAGDETPPGGEGLPRCVRLARA